MVRKKRDSGRDSFELTPEKANKLHDDRAYTACLASYALMMERRKHFTEKPTKQNIDYSSIFKIRAPKKSSRY